MQFYANLTAYRVIRKIFDLERRNNYVRNLYFKKQINVYHC